MLPLTKLSHQIAAGPAVQDGVRHKSDQPDSRMDHDQGTFVSQFNLNRYFFHSPEGMGSKQFAEIGGLRNGDSKDLRFWRYVDGSSTVYQTRI